MTDAVPKHGDKKKTNYKQCIHRWRVAWHYIELLPYTEVTCETSCMISTHEIINITVKCYKAFLFWYRLDISELWTRVWNSSLTFFRCHSNSCGPHDGIPLPLAHSWFVLLIWLQIRPSSHHPVCGYDGFGLMHPGMNAGFLTSVQFFLIRSESWAKVWIKSTKFFPESGKTRQQAKTSSKLWSQVHKTNSTRQRTLNIELFDDEIYVLRDPSN